MSPLGILQNENFHKMFFLPEKLSIYKRFAKPVGLESLSANFSSQIENILSINLCEFHKGSFRLSVKPFWLSKLEHDIFISFYPLINWGINTMEFTHKIMKEKNVQYENCIK